MVITAPRYNYFTAVTLSDSVDIATGITDALWVGTKGATGTVVAVREDGTAVTFVGVAAGTLLPIAVKRVNNTTTDVSNVVALYSR